LDDPPDPNQLVLIGPLSPLEAVDITTVAHERLAVDERFRTAICDLSGQGTSTDRVVSLAQNAWWAIRQSVHLDGGLLELQRFERALADLDTLTANLFKACQDLLHASIADSEMRAERCRAVVKAVVYANVPGSVLALVRTWKDATTLRSAIAEELHLMEEDLEELGICVGTVYAAPRSPAPGTAVLVGYSGMIAIDAVLASGARRAHTIFDPVETRIAWYNAQSMADYLDRAGATDAAGPFHRFANDLSPHVVGFTNIQELSTNQVSRLPESDRRIVVTRPSQDEALVYLTDGGCLEVSLGSRFEVLGRKGFGSRVVPVTALEPDDEIVLLDDEARTLFSEQRVATLDAGPLKEQCQARSQWLAIVQAVVKAKRLNPATIAREIMKLGYRITEAAVRSWLDERLDEAHAPMGIDHFLALADVLDINLTEEMLRHYYKEIRLWRIGHRRAGREVAQAIRLAYTGRLGPVTLARIEHDWGVGMRELIAAARVGIVDEVILPEEANNA
jgi:xanthosine utilization system XapX-like protein